MSTDSTTGRAPLRPFRIHPKPHFHVFCQVGKKIKGAVELLLHIVTVSRILFINLRRGSHLEFVPVKGDEVGQADQCLIIVGRHQAVHDAAQGLSFPASKDCWIIRYASLSIERLIVSQEQGHVRGYQRYPWRAASTSGGVFRPPGKIGHIVSRCSIQCAARYLAIKRQNCQP